MYQVHSTSSFVPELRLSVSILFNGGTDEFGASQYVLILCFLHLWICKEIDLDKPLQPADQSSFLNYTLRVRPWHSRYWSIYCNWIVGAASGTVRVGLYLESPTGLKRRH